MLLLDTIFISLGISYIPEKFKSVRNFSGYCDLNNPPVKPTYGGLWSSPYLKDSPYISDWYYFVSLYGDSKLKHSLTYPSTLFKLYSNSKILHLRTLDDVTLTETKCNDKIYIPTFRPICTPSIPKELQKLKFIDYKSISETYDAIYIDDTVLDDTLGALEWNCICKSVKYSSNLQKAMLFHSWDVPTLFVLNKDCIDILDIISPIKN